MVKRPAICSNKGMRRASAERLGLRKAGTHEASPIDSLKLWIAGWTAEFHAKTTRTAAISGESTTVGAKETVKEVISLHDAVSKFLRDQGTPLTPVQQSLLAQLKNDPDLLRRDKSNFKETWQTYRYDTEEGRELGRLAGQSQDIDKLCPHFSYVEPTRSPDEDGTRRFTEETTGRFEVESRGHNVIKLVDSPVVAQVPVPATVQAHSGSIRKRLFAAVAGVGVLLSGAYVAKEKLFDGHGENPQENLIKAGFDVSRVPELYEHTVSNVFLLDLDLNNMKPEDVAKFRRVVELIDDEEALVYLLENGTPDEIVRLHRALDHCFSIQKELRKNEGLKKDKERAIVAVRDGDIAAIEKIDEAMSSELTSAEELVVKTYGKPFLEFAKKRKIGVLDATDCSMLPRGSNFVFAGDSQSAVRSFKNPNPNMHYNVRIIKTSAPKEDEDRHMASSPK